MMIAGTLGRSGPAVVQKQHYTRRNFQNWLDFFGETVTLGCTKASPKVAQDNLPCYNPWIVPPRLWVVSRSLSHNVLLFKFFGGDYLEE